MYQLHFLNDVYGSYLTCLLFAYFKVVTSPFFRECSIHDISSANPRLPRFLKLVYQYRYPVISLVKDPSSSSTKLTVTLRCPHFCRVYGKVKVTVSKRHDCVSDRKVIMATMRYIGFFKGVENETRVVNCYGILFRKCVCLEFSFR